MTHYKLNRLQSIVNEYINTKIASTTNSRIKLTPSQIQKLYESNTLDSLYIDANMIDFVYSIKHLANNNKQEYYSMLKGINNILRLRNQIQTFYDSNGTYPENTSQLLQTCIGLRTNVKNNLHNFIYSIPSSKFHHDILQRFDTLVSRNVDAIHKCYLHANKMNGINSSTQIVIYNTQQPFDTTHSPHLFY
jgi:hypothetical protein